jgi:uncharacterized protein DUF1579
MKRFALTGAFCVSLMTAPILADDKPKFDEKAAMEAMAKAAAVTDNHKALQHLVGEWDVTTKFWMDPSQPPSESKGTASHKWIMGNRYVHESVKGNFGGMEFEGSGVVGYDNLEQKYVFAWIDNMGTGIEHGVGKMDKDAKTLTFHHEEIDAMTGKKAKGKDVTTMIDDDSFKTEFYRLEGDKEVKMMEVTYKRKK